MISCIIGDNVHSENENCTNDKTKMYKPEPDEQEKIVTNTTHSRDIEVMPMGS